MRHVGDAFGRTVLVVLATLCLTACSGDNDGATEVDQMPDTPESVARATLDEVGCTYDGEETPKAPFFYMDTTNLTSSWGSFEVNRIPADVSNVVVEAFFNSAQLKLEQGQAFSGIPADWSLMRRGGMPTGTGSMLVGDPMPGNPQQLIAGQRYVLWCSTSEPPTLSTSGPPTAVFLAAVIEATE